MSFVRLLRDDEPEKDRYRPAVGCVERNGKFRSYECSCRRGTLTHARMWNGESVADTRRAKLLPYVQTFKN